MGRLPQACRSKQADCWFSNVYVFMHMYGEVMGLAQAARPRPIAFPKAMYITMYIETWLGRNRQTAPGRLLAFPFHMNVCTYFEMLGHA